MFYFACVKCLDSFFSIKTGCYPVNIYHYFGGRDVCLVSVDSDKIEATMATETSVKT